MIVQPHDIVCNKKIVSHDQAWLLHMILKTTDVLTFTHHSLLILEMLTNSLVKQLHALYFYIIN